MKRKLGWIPDHLRTRKQQQAYHAARADIDPFSIRGQNIRGSGAGKTVLIWKFMEQVYGSYPYTIQEIGDCVGVNSSTCIQNTHAVEIALYKENQKFPGIVATEWGYGTSRVLVGGGRLGNDDGSIGSWFAKAVQEHGVLFRQKYTGASGKEYDLTSYSGRRAKSWGYRGLPLELEEIADETPVTKAVMIDTYEEARDMLANGYSISVCSMQGFSDRRDNEGFARPQGTWPHCMAVIAVDDDPRRPGVLIDNRSWGLNWISGPKRHDQPEGTFWCDADVFERRMLRERDSYAYIDVVAPENRVDDLINYNLW